MKNAAEAGEEELGPCVVVGSVGSVIGNIVVRLGYDPGWKVEPVLWSSQRLPDKPKSAPVWVAEDDDECDKMPKLDDKAPRTNRFLLLRLEKFLYSGPDTEW